ncbi:MAG TPA: DsbA family protein [Steroidobacteraceae bacterium]|nr:DsbA family protein [Steroidobacteraceae bacterium]
MARWYRDRGDAHTLRRAGLRAGPALRRLRFMRRTLRSLIRREADRAAAPGARSASFFPAPATTDKSPGKRSGSRAAFAVIVAAVALAGCAVNGRVTEQQTEAPAAPQPGDYRSLGSPEAPVTIIEFTDLQCPYCARFALETWPVLRARYVETGTVHFVSRDLPLPYHEFALPAAVAARCAGEQGKFWEFREALFRGQSKLATAPYEEIARRFGLDVARFAACRTDASMIAAVRGDAALAARHGIASTPTFVVGRVVDGQFTGEVIPGARPIEVFVEKIEQATSGEPAQQ